MINKQQKKNQRLIIIIFGMTLIPFLIAWGLKEHPSLVKGTTNSGQLVIPPVVIKRTELTGLDDFSKQNIGELPGHWLIVNVIPNTGCNDVCLEALLKTKQLRLMLNKELPRTRRVVVVFNQPLEASAQQWWLKDALLWRLNRLDDKDSKDLYTSLLHEEKILDDGLVEQLIKNEDRDIALSSDLIRVKPSAEVIKIMSDIRKGAVPEGMLFLIDPLGNLMMHYEPGFSPYKVKEDLMHLLRISQIG